MESIIYIGEGQNYLKLYGTFLRGFKLIRSFAGDDDDINKRRTSKNTGPSCVVDDSIEISNILFTPKDFELTNYLIKKLVSKDYFYS